MIPNSKLKRLALISLNDHVPWGGSEVLWASVGLRLHLDGGAQVAISPKKWEATPTEILKLLDAGAFDYRREEKPFEIVMRKSLSALFPSRSEDIYRYKHFAILDKFKPDLAVISLGDHNHGGDWMDACLKREIPYVLIVQLVKDGFFPPSGDRYFNELRDGYRFAKQVLCASYDNQLILEKQFAMPLPNISIVNNPIQCTDSIPAYPENPVAQWAMVASLNPNHKGQDILFEVLRMDKWKQRPVQVNLYGSGAHESILKQLANHWDLQNVSFCGHQPIEQIWRDNHLLVMPTRMEGLSLAFLEAMKSERTAIITQLGDSDRFIDDDVNGFLIRAPNAALLDEAMERAWSRRDDWKEMGKAAHRRLEREIPRDPVLQVVDMIKDYLQ